MNQMVPNTAKARKVIQKPIAAARALALDGVVEIGRHRQLRRRAIFRAATSRAVRNGTRATAIFSFGD